MTDHFARPTPEASFDEALAQLLDRRSYTAQILLAAADLLDDAPTEPLADYVRDQAMDWAARAVTKLLPAAITTESFTRATAALPPVWATTHGEYAARLRTAAEVL